MLVSEGSWVAADTVRVSPARLSTKRCHSGSLTALTVLRPLSLALTAESWEMSVSSELGPQTMGAERQIKHGPTTALLRGVNSQAMDSLRGVSEGLVARLRHGQMAFEGLVAVSQGAEGVSLTFKETPALEMV